MFRRRPPLYGKPGRLQILAFPKSAQSYLSGVSHGPTRVVGLLLRSVGYVLFLFWCAAVGAALSVVGVVRLGRLALSGARGVLPIRP